MTESTVFLLVIVGVVLFIVAIAFAIGNASLRRFMGRSYERSAMLILHDHNPRALYFVATMRGTDAARIKKAIARSKRRPFVWMTQAGRIGAPGRTLLGDALTEIIAEGDVVWNGELTPAIEERVRTKLADGGVEMSGLRLAVQVPFDHAAHARDAWWVCYVDYEGVAGQLCCSGLELWLDAQGAGLWSLKTRGRASQTSVQIAGEPEFQILCHPAHELDENVLGGPLKDSRNLTLAEMATPPVRG